MPINLDKPAAAAAPAKPVTAPDATPAPAKPAKPRKPRASAKPAAAKPAKRPAKPDPLPTGDALAEAVAQHRANRLARDAATIAAGRANFATVSNRDDAYMQFFGAISRKLGKLTLTLADIADHGVTRDGRSERNPFYAKSSKATDAGAIKRVADSGRIKRSDCGSKITITARGKACKFYSSGELPE